MNDEDDYDDPDAPLDPDREYGIAVARARYRVMHLDRQHPSRVALETFLQANRQKYRGWGQDVTRADPAANR